MPQISTEAILKKEGQTEGDRILNRHAEELAKLAEKARSVHGFTPQDVILVAIEKSCPLWEALVETCTEVPPADEGYELTSYCGVLKRNALDMLIKCAPGLPRLIEADSHIWGYTTLLMGPLGISVSYIPITEGEA